MPLYKKSIFKSKIKSGHQKSFISPLTNENIITLNDYYTGSLSSSQKLHKSISSSFTQKSSSSDIHKNSRKEYFKSSTIVDVSKTKNGLEKHNKSYKNDLKIRSKSISSTLSDLNKNISQFSSQELQKSLENLKDISQNSSKNVKNGSGVIIGKFTSVAEISSNTDGNLPEVTRTSDSPNSTLSDMLNDCVITNIRLSQQLLHIDEAVQNKNKGGGDARDNYQEDKDNANHENSISSLLDDCVKENILLSQEKLEKELSKQKKLNKDTKKNSKVYNELKEKTKNKYLIEKKMTREKIMIKNKSASNVKSFEDKQDNRKPKKFRKEIFEKESREFVGKGIKKDRKKSSNHDKNEDKNTRNMKTDKNIDKEKSDRKQNKLKEVNRSRESLENHRKSNKNSKNKENKPPTPNNMIFITDDARKKENIINHAMDLQKTRDVGLYVFCDSCDKVRYLPNCKDPLELPHKWFCYMNPDKNYNKCSDPNVEINAETAQLLIDNQYNAGSVVWARMDGYPWWPAMVDDDPDLEDYFWTEVEDNTPTWYHVTFFDSSDVTRQWIRTRDLKPFEINVKLSQNSKKNLKYKKRLDISTKQAKDAVKMELLDRLREYSFVMRYFPKKKEKKQHKNHNINKKKVKKTKSDDKKAVNNAKNKQNKVTNIKKYFSELKERRMSDQLSDALSIASSEISELLKPKKSGKNNRILSEDDEMLETIDLDHFMGQDDTIFDNL